MIPGEDEESPAGEIETQRRARKTRHGSKVANTRRPADPGRLALPLLRDQRGARASTATQAYGFRLNIAAGTAVRFEPGQTRTVELVALAGDAQGVRLPGQGDGQARMSAQDLRDAGLRGDVRPDHAATACGSPTPSCGSRSRRTSPIYGEEVKFGGGKVIRDGMGQSQRAVAGGRRHGDHQRADRRPLGHRQGRHRHQGRAHRGDRQGRQSRHPARRRPSSSAPAPRSSPARA